MSDTEDVKPKDQRIELIVTYQGQSQKYSVKPHTQLKKIFDAAAQAFEINSKYLRFHDEAGDRLNPVEMVDGKEVPATVSMYGLEDGAQIAAEVEQLGGFSTL